MAEGRIGALPAESLMPALQYPRVDDTPQIGLSRQEYSSVEPCAIMGSACSVRESAFSEIFV